MQSDWLPSQKHRRDFGGPTCEASCLLLLRGNRRARPEQAREIWSENLVRVHGRCARNHRTRFAWSYGKTDRECRSGARLTLHRHITAEKQCEPPGDGESEPRSARPARRLLLHLPEGLEDALEVFRAYSNSGILDGYDQLVSLLVAGKNDAAAVGEFHGVAQQIDDHLTYFHRVRFHHHFIRRQHHFDVKAAGAGKRLDQLRGRLENRRQGRALQVHFLATGVDSRECQYLIDQREQVTRAGFDSSELLRLLIGNRAADSVCKQLLISHYRG